MNQHPIPSTCVVLPSGGRAIQASGDEITVHLGGAETGGKYTMFTAVAPPGGGPLLHYHANEDEWFFVLEGRAELFEDNDRHGGIHAERRGPCVQESRRQAAANVGAHGSPANRQAGKPALVRLKACLIGEVEVLFRYTLSGL